MSNLWERLYALLRTSGMATKMKMINAAGDIVTVSILGAAAGPIDVAGRIQDVQGRRILIHVDEVIPIGSSIRLQWRAHIVLGEITGTKQVNGTLQYVFEADQCVRVGPKPPMPATRRLASSDVQRLARTLKNVELAAALLEEAAAADVSVAAAYRHLSTVRANLVQMVP